MIQEAEIVFLTLLLFVVVFAALARKLQTPYPIVLVVAGLILGFVPGIPRIPLNPDVIFLLVLPPLLYSAAWLTSWREFKYHLVSILLLAFGLVGFTGLGVAYTAHWLFAGFDVRLGFVFGAVVGNGQTQTVAFGVLRLAYLIAAGVAIGIVVGLLVKWIEPHIDDGPIE